MDFSNLYLLSMFLFFLLFERGMTINGTLSFVVL